MTSWTRNQDIRKRLERKWATGEILTLCVSDQPFEPLRIPLKHPTARELTHQFDKARTWVAQIKAQAGKQNRQSSIKLFLKKSQSHTRNLPDC